MTKVCCEVMSHQVEAQASDSSDILIVYVDKFEEYGLPVRDGGPSYSLISYCPWCGTKLPTSRRDEWFDELESLGIDDPWTQDYPDKYRSGEWYREKGSE